MDKDIALKKAIDALDFKGVRDSETYWKMMNEAIQACKEALEQPALVCEVCGSTMTDEELAEKKKTNPQLISCCPDRKMVEQPAQEPVAWMEEYQSCKVNGDERLCHSDKVFRLVQLLANQLSDCQSLCAKYAEKTVINGEQKIKEVRAIKEGKVSLGKGNKAKQR